MYKKELQQFSFYYSLLVIFYFLYGILDELLDIARLDVIDYSIVTIIFIGILPLYYATIKYQNIGLTKFHGLVTALGLILSTLLVISFSVVAIFLSGSIYL